MLITDFKRLESLIRPEKIYNIYHFRPIERFSIDSRSIRKGEAFIALCGRHYDGHDFIAEAIKKGAGLIISQKDIPCKNNVPFFLVEDSIKSFKQIAAYIRKKKNPFVYAISGSVGKTTTKDMLAFLLEGNTTVLKNCKTENNIFGVGKTIFSLRNEKVLVLELGTNHPGEIKELAEIVYPDCGIITFIKPVHLEGLGSLPGIFEEKISMLKANSRVKAVLNRDDNYLRKVNFCRNTYWFGKGKNNHLYGRRLTNNLRECVFLVQDRFKLTLSSGFDAFLYNTLAAILGASLLDLPIEQLVEKMNNFKNFSPQRMQIQKVGNFVFLNDAYNANPYSFKQALSLIRRYSCRKVAVIGDMLELGYRSGYYHQALAKDIISANFDYVFTFGEFTAQLKDRLKTLGYSKVYHCASHDEITYFIKEKATAGQLIFLKGSRKMALEKVIDNLSCK
jgi:UDP-N-acetylmuramoyl-tripeptide--D-alanyl-D-alanine ligase